MAEQLTPQQRAAVENRGGKLLVSASAGSGKTKVLVDRLMGYLTDPSDPANIDEFLIITYTKAAASELRGKIAAKLSQRLAEEGQNRHLQRQMQRLYMTQISTVHSFCAELMKQFAYQLDLPADIRVADEDECRQLRAEVMDQVLEAAYGEADLDFCAFIDSQGVGRNDKNVPEVLMKVYDSARCHLDPHGWLQGCLDELQLDVNVDISQTRWGKSLMEELFDFLDLQLVSIEHCLQLLEEAEGGEKQVILFRQMLEDLRFLRQSESWDQIIARKDIRYGTLRFGKKFTDDELKAGVTTVRNACKEGLKKLLEGFADCSARAMEDLNDSAWAVRGMVALVRRFETEYQKAKLRRRIVDFGDLEHYTLDLLYGKRRSGITGVAREIAGRFREVMVDEYQDSNEVQDAIYAALTAGRGNCFMVGDVKQSIYQFRLADPGIFLEKYKTFVSAEEANPGQGRKVLLSSNFRSGGAVLAAVNDVFETCMSPAVGGLDYGEAEALREGIPHVPLGEPEVELHCVCVEENTYAQEAAYVAKRIGELTDGSHFVRDGEQLRPIALDDIVILLRSPGSVGERFRIVLENAGIPCAFGSGADLLRTEHIGVLRSLLQTIHNPQLDIPLIATLASPLFGFSADDLAGIRGGNTKCSFYDALCRSDNVKVREFLHTLTHLRHVSRTVGLTQLIDIIFDITHLDGIYASMEDGEARTADIQAFYEIVVKQESSTQQDLGRFLDYLLMMEGRGIASAKDTSSAGRVTIMSIHKSKGLEFPVVFLCNLSRRFNHDSKSGQVLCHKELGIGISVANQDRRVRYPTIAKRAVANRIGADGLSEELRVLYVAMTRARDRLIMTYASDNLEPKLQEMVCRLNMGQKELLTREVSCPGDWVLLTALGRLEAGALFALGGATQNRKFGTFPWLVHVAEPPDNVAIREIPAVQQQISKEDYHRLQRNLQFRYPHPAATVAPSKQTATQKKGRPKDAEAAENAPMPKMMTFHPRKPDFVERRVLATEYGNVHHAVMQFLNYAACVDLESVIREIDRLVNEGFLSPEQAGLVDAQKIAAFFQTEIGRKMVSGMDVLREFKFTILEDATQWDNRLTGEQILLQGVVDCALVESDGITIVDFKTDKVTEEMLSAAVQRYRSQVNTYSDAMQRIYQLPVKGCYLYFFRLSKLISV